MSVESICHYAFWIILGFFQPALTGIISYPPCLSSVSPRYKTRPSRNLEEHWERSPPMSAGDSSTYCNTRKRDRTVIKLPSDLPWFLELFSTGFFSDFSRLFQLLWEVARFFVSNDLCLKRYILYPGWWFQPLWKIWKSMGRMTSHILYGKNMFETTSQVSLIATYQPIVPALTTWKALRHIFVLGWAATVGMVRPGFTQKQWVKLLKSHWGKNHVITMKYLSGSNLKV